jgi:hypothetical protein
MITKYFESDVCSLCSVNARQVGEQKLLSAEIAERIEFMLRNDPCLAGKIKESGHDYEVLRE